MKDSELEIASVLGLSHELGLLQTLDNQLSKSFPQSCFDKAPDFQTGVQYLASYTYDLVVLDMSMTCGHELIIRALAHKFPVLVLVDNDSTLSPAEQAISSNALAILHKRKINEIHMDKILGKRVRAGNNSKWNRISGEYKKFYLKVNNFIFKRKQKRSTLLISAG